jgi:hypothetical protein
MNPYVNEEVMWQRLKDLQQEAESRRRFAAESAPGFVRLLAAIGHSAWAAVHALGIAPRWWVRHAAALTEDEVDAHVA